MFVLLAYLFIYVYIYQLGAGQDASRQGRRGHAVAGGAGAYCSIRIVIVWYSNSIV